MAETKEKALPGNPAVFVYKGVAKMQKGPLCHSYQEFKDGELGESWTLKKRMLGYEKPGALVGCRLSEDGQSIYGVGRVAAGTFPDEETVVRWALNSRAVEDGVKAEKASRKLAGKDPIEDAVAPLRLAYARASPATRPQMLARIIYLLTK